MVWRLVVIVYWTSEDTEPLEPLEPLATQESSQDLFAKCASNWHLCCLVISGDVHESSGVTVGRMINFHAECMQSSYRAGQLVVTTVSHRTVKVRWNPLLSLWQMEKLLGGKKRETVLQGRRFWPFNLYGYTCTYYNMFYMTCLHTIIYSDLTLSECICFNTLAQKTLLHVVRTVVVLRTVDQWTLKQLFYSCFSEFDP